jgi:hypothetical protein
MWTFVLCSKKTCIRFLKLVIPPWSIIGLVFFFRIERQNELISNAHRSVLETEEVGMEITAELSRNREKIESSRSKVRTLNIKYIHRGNIKFFNGNCNIFIRPQSTWALRILLGE